MFFWACKLASSPSPKLSFSNRIALSTKFCAFLFFCGNSISHHYLILFIKFLPFCLSSLFICPNFDVSSFVHFPLFMIWILWLRTWLAVFSAWTCSTTASLATPCVCWVWKWFWSVSPIKIWNWNMSSVHPGLPSTLDKAIVSVLLPLLPDFVIGDLNPAAIHPYRNDTVKLWV